MILSRIIEEKRKEVDLSRDRMPIGELKKEAMKIRVTGSFKKSISRPHHMNLIAEMKKASPSKGIIRGDFNPAKIAVAYQANGASAISVLTDERFFEGRPEYIKVVKENSSLPVLRKDFIIDEYQIYESVVLGADAILLISDILSFNDMKAYYDLAVSLGLDVILEVHDQEDLEKAVKTGGGIIGINNRDLGTFRTDLATTQKLVSLIPPHKVIVSESGIKTHEDLMFLKSIGVHAVLIGEAFMEASDIGQKVKELLRNG